MSKSDFLKYGIPDDLAKFMVNAGLTIGLVRSTPSRNLVKKYGIAKSQASFIKKCLKRRAIESAVLEDLLLNNNFTCCACLGQKGLSFLVHHIVPYEVSQDNSYTNLAVLCPVCHDLAHRSAALTLSISARQLKRAKLTWENACRSNRALAGRHVSPFYETWQAHVEEEDMEYLLDLSLRQEGKDIVGFFTAIYLARGNTMLQGQFRHMFSKREQLVKLRYWEMQWGRKYGAIQTSEIIVNYAFSNKLYVKKLDSLNIFFPEIIKFDLKGIE